MTAHTMTVWHEPVHEAERFLPEGPRAFMWNDRPGLLWVNIQKSSASAHGSLHFLPWDADEPTIFPMPGRPGFVLPSVDPDLLYVGMGKELGYFRLSDRTWHPVATIPDDHPRTTINDGEPLPDGSGVIFGTKDLRFAEPLGHLYLHDLTLNSIVVLRGGQTCSNGKVMIDSTLYDIDSPTRTVVRYRWNSDQLSLEYEGIALDFRRWEFFPDGMCGCGDGSVIVAFYNPQPHRAGLAVRYRLDTAEELDGWELPGSPRVTCPLLANTPTGPRLFCTTATEGMPSADRELCPHAGSLFSEAFAGFVPPPVRVLAGIGGLRRRIG